MMCWLWLMRRASFPVVYSAAAGSEMVKVEPWPAPALLAVILPPCISTIGFRLGRRRATLTGALQCNLAADRAVFDGIAQKVVDRLAHAVTVAHDHALWRGRD